MNYTNKSRKQDERDENKKAISNMASRVSPLKQGNTKLINGNVHTLCPVTKRWYAA